MNITALCVAPIFYIIETQYKRIITLLFGRLATNYINRQHTRSNEICPTQQNKIFNFGILGPIYEEIMFTYPVIKTYDYNNGTDLVKLCGEIIFSLMNFNTSYPIIMTSLITTLKRCIDYNYPKIFLNESNVKYLSYIYNILFGLNHSPDLNPGNMIMCVLYHSPINICAHYYGKKFGLLMPIYIHSYGNIVNIMSSE